MPLPELYSRVERYVPPVEWPLLAEDIGAILKLKREKNAVILAHNYQTPDIFHTVGDIVGDSLALAREATRTEAEVIVLAGVHFMAETAKLLNPDKTVLIPDTRAGCSLAESITAADVRLMRERHPGVPIVTYVNTSAAVKAALHCPDLDFVRPRNLCPHKQRITLGNIRDALETMTHEVTVARDIAAKARLSVERMLEIG